MAIPAFFSNRAIYETSGASLKGRRFGLKEYLLIGRTMACWIATAAYLFVSGLSFAGPQDADWRNLRLGNVIGEAGYADQPYVVVLPNGEWLCTATIGPGKEGQTGQHIAAFVSSDKGKHWSSPIPIESPQGAEASWAVPLLTPFGRVYVFYTFNGDNVRTLNEKPIRADVLGWYVYRYSDDFGRTWSERYRLPMRVTACDRTNDWKGSVQLFWGICKPQVAERRVLFSFTKLGKYMLELGEGWVFCSGNILEEREPTRLQWELFPPGDRGIRNDQFGSVQEEHNLVWLGENTWYCVYRTTLGYPAQTYSFDGGKTWEVPSLMTYEPGGRPMKNPRACPKLYRTSEGRLLFWFHNHSGTDFFGRNPAWLSAGTVKNGRVYWSQPEILLYDPDPQVRFSYPDFFEDEGRMFVTETQKTVARVHEIDREFLNVLFQQGTLASLPKVAPLVEIRSESPEGPKPLTRTIDLAEDSGFSVEMWIRLDHSQPGRILVDNRDATNRGFVISLGEENSYQVELNDGLHSFAWSSDPGTIQVGKRQHVVIIVDSGPKLMMFVVDGQLCDGGEHRQYGWARWTDDLRQVTGQSIWINPALKDCIHSLRIFGRPLRVSEAVSLYRAGSH